MDKQENWMKKRMEDIPKPIAIGNANLTKEQLSKGREDLKKIIEASTGKKVEGPPVEVTGGIFMQ